MGQVQLHRWSQGRVVLLGDAGCCPSPLTGLGTSLALVGAYILGGGLAASAATTTEETAIRGAFERYERQMPVRGPGQELPPGGADGYTPTSRLRISMGRASMRWSQRWPLRVVMERVFSEADAINLPNYPGLSLAQPRRRPRLPVPPQRGGRGPVRVVGCAEGAGSPLSRSAPANVASEGGAGSLMSGAVRIGRPTIWSTSMGVALRVVAKARRLR